MTAPTDTAFLACLPFTLAQEAPIPNDWSNSRNFSDDPHDPGGETMNGIIQTEYDAYRKANGLPLQDVSKLSQAEGYAIYYQNYWLPNCPKLQDGLNLCVFDESVNAGPRRSTIILQGALGVPSDGIWGPQTDAAVAAIVDVTAVINTFTAGREAYYRALSTFKYFGTDWIRRSEEIGAEALKMGIMI